MLVEGEVDILQLTAHSETSAGGLLRYEAFPSLRVQLGGDFGCGF